MTNAQNARRYLRARDAGILSTISVKLAGYPFGSVVAFVADHDALPVILVSGLAEHTKNMTADPRVSLLVREPAADVQGSARLTFIGEARRFAADDAFRARFLRLQPQGEQLLALGDFGFFRIHPTAIRFIEGFGSIHWVSPAAYAPPANTIAAIEPDVLAHMNADHRAALAAYAGAQAVPDTPVEMIGIDCDGFDMRVGDARRRIDFDEPVTEAGEVRAALARLARR